jgi:hypothetical protein
MQTGYESQSHRASVALNEDVMAELADGSGGSYFHDSNDWKRDSKTWRPRQNMFACSSSYSMG